ncbi:IS66 family transposase [Oligella ureolytica]
MTNSLPSFPTDLSTLSAAQLLVIIKEKDAVIAQTGVVIARAEAVIAQKEKTNQTLTFRIDQLTMELATLRRISFAKRSEQLPDLQARLFEEDALTDIAEVEAKLESLRQELAQESGPVEAPKATAKSRVPAGFRLPADLPSVEIRHDLESTSCSCGCEMRHIGDDVSQKLDYEPGTFTVENHLRPKYVCDTCKTLNQAPVPAHIIDKGLATTGLLASVLIMKYADHLPLYRQETIFERAGLRIARSTLADWVGACGAQLEPLVDALREQVLAHSVLHADETPLQYHNHQKKEVKRGYVWVYAPGEFESLKAVIYDFKPGRSGAYAREFLGDWRGSLMCDDYAGYKALFASGQVIEGGCWAHARRKFHAIYEANQSEVAAQALKQIQLLYQHEAVAKGLSPPERLAYRRQHMRPLVMQFETWLQAQFERVPPNSAIAKAIRYTLNNWAALTRLLDNAQMPMDNNAVENLIRPLAIGRKNWLFAGSEIAGRRAAAVMSLIHSARLNGHDPQAYLKDVLERQPTHKAKDIDDLLPHRWHAATAEQ